ncbi:MAG TPA: N,N-dimethylformamidase beta subunit family domain-containing protein [Thermoanaerobaculia bacterium]|nr:N,N-dimethylformamidase beta subunit family domain-containing protein [Thermoanaerobaculia bacterium]
MEKDAPQNPAKPLKINRRQLLQGAAAAGVVSALGGLQLARSRSARKSARAGGAVQSDLIRTENAKPGTTDWLLTRTEVDPATRYRCPAIEGYCSRTSLRAGERLSFHVSTNPPSPFTLDLYRMGYYGGKGGRLVERLGPFTGRVQPDPEIGPERLRDCRWEAATEIVIPADWPSGVYLGKLTASTSGLQSYVIFIVRDDRPCDVLFQSSDTTWAAYNRWPSQFSLYDNGRKIWYWGPGVRVSFNRPYGKYCQIVDSPLSQGSGEFLLWEHPLAFWLEQNGYDVSYVSNLDTHSDLQGLLRAGTWVSVGHDEYWTREMHDHVQAARDAGVNLAFLSANTCYGLIDLGADGLGTAHRTLSRLGQYGPIEAENVPDFPEILGLTQHGPDESLLIGARTNYPLTGGSDWTCALEKHWLFEGTGMKEGDSIPGLVGWEWHGDAAALPGLEVVATGNIRPRGRNRTQGHYAATVYPGPKGNFVFNGATIWWSTGLSSPPGFTLPRFGRTRPQGPDPRVARMTANLLARGRRGA